MCLDADAPALHDYLGKATDYIDLVIDQSPSGRMEILPGTQEYDVAANWKLMVENSVDDYHLPSTHSTWLNFMANSGVKVEPPKDKAGQVLPTKGYAIDLGNGHFTTDNVNFRGRPVAKWISLYGEPAKAEIEEIRAELVRRLGEERATRVADTNRNLVIFPNLVINDGSSVTVRTFFPNGVGKMQVTAWALGPVEESESARARRLDAFLTFYGPGGFATPDDVEALEMVQQGLANWQDDRWSEMSRGMGRQNEQLNSDEHHLRTFWRRLRDEMIGSAGMTRRRPRRPRRVNRTLEIEDFLFREAALLDNWQLDEWQQLLTDDACYYVPPNDDPEGSPRNTLFIIADDRERIRQRIIRVLDPNCHARTSPKSHLLAYHRQ